ncbi:MAG: tetratricopeptide repeat protein [Saprospiraceae bacterium]|nr:tetratricopeptide repeat protein [Saprospiraceae bacterium]
MIYVYRKFSFILWLMPFFGFGQGVCVPGDSLFLKQNFVAAAEAYTLCISEDSTAINARFSLAKCYDQLGDWAKAKTLYHDLEYTENVDVIYRLAAIYESQQNLPKAIKYYRKLQQLFPKNPQYPRKLGALYLLGHEQGQAFVSYQQALKIAPEDLASIMGLAEMMYQMDNLNGSDSLVQTGLQLDSMHFGLAYLNSRIMYRQKNYSGAAKQLLFLAANTDLPLAYNNLLGYSLIQTDSFDQAVFYLRRTLQKEPKNEYALFYLGLAFEKKNDFNEAMYFFQEAAKAGISENMHLFYQGQARISSRKGMYQQVIKSYEKSLEYNFEPEMYLYMAGAAESAYKNKSKAIRYYKKFLEYPSGDEDKIKLAKSRLSYLEEKKFMEGKPK